MIPAHWRRAALEPPTAHGAPLGTGVLRSSPEDFVVDEVLGFEAGGEGPHALLRVRKRGANTEWVARELARAAGCKPFDVGFAGLKDRHAVTTQYFTVPRTTAGRQMRAAEEFAGLAGEGYEVLSAAPHPRKLPRGALEGNRFAITVRGFSAGAEALRARLERIRTAGVPNYFGPQRFGRDAGNLSQVARRGGALVETQQGAESRGGGHAPRRGRGRGDDGFMLSAARSVVFNAVLTARVADGTWHRLQSGDVANLDGRGSIFAVEAVDEALAARCAALEVHPTGPLIGADESLARGTVRALEDAVAGAFPEALAVIRAEGMRGERRALRLGVRELEYEHSGEVLCLRFRLPAGSFATTVLREIIADTTGGE